MIRFGQWIFEKDGRLLVAVIVVGLLVLGVLGGIVWKTVYGIIWIISHFL